MFEFYLMIKQIVTKYTTFLKNNKMIDKNN
jgi:hypothetical protein